MKEKRTGGGYGSCQQQSTGWLDLAGELLFAHVFVQGRVWPGEAQLGLYPVRSLGIIQRAERSP